jgi:hypothetical protein
MDSGDVLFDIGYDDNLLPSGEPTPGLRPDRCCVTGKTRSLTKVCDRRRF